jgi:WD40 repeat protein
MRLASAGDDATVRIWNLEGVLLRELPGHADSLRSLDFGGSGKLLASGSDDGMVRIWDTETGAKVCTLSGHSRWLFSVAFSPDGDSLASAGEDGTIVIWDVSTESARDSIVLDRQYERMNIAGVRGLSDAQTSALKALGAVQIR